MRLKLAKRFHDLLRRRRLLPDALDVASAAETVLLHLRDRR